MLIRKMNENDVDQIARLWSMLFIDQTSRNEYINNKDVKYSSNDSLRNRYLDCYKNPNCEILVADLYGKVKGFIEVWLYKKDFYFDVDDYAYILHFFIEKDFKSELSYINISLKLVRAAKEWAQQHNCKHLGCDVYGFNTNVQRWVEKLGFNPYKIRYMKKLENNQQENNEKTT